MKEKKNRGTAKYGIAAVVLVMIVYTIICYIVIDRYPGKFRAGEIDEDSRKELIAVTLDHMTTLPLPDSGASVEWQCGTYYSNITKTDMEAYMKRLSEAGWKDASGKEINTSISSGTTIFDLLNGDHVLQLMTFYEGGDYSFYNSILVYYDNNASLSKMKNRQGAMKKAEVMPFIQTQVNELSKQGVLPENKDKVTGLFEIYIEGGYDRLQLQAFAAYGDMGFIGCFLVRKGIVSYVPDNLSNAQVTDIDLDGKYELLDAYNSWEGNTFRLELVVYEYKNAENFNSLTEVLQQKYYNIYVPVNGHDAFKLNMDRSGAITLIGETKDYGRIQVVDGNLVIVGTEAVGFLSWKEAYDQGMLSTIDKIYPEEPPEINISLDGMKLDYIIKKKSWAGLTQATTAEVLIKEFEQQKNVPTVNLETAAVNESAPRITIDFGDSIPDKIMVYDAMLTKNNSIRYQMNTEQAVQIIDEKNVAFPLTQHFAYYLSSNSEDYKKDWKRLFEVVCSWKDKKCSYVFIINTKGKKLSGN